VVADLVEDEQAGAAGAQGAAIGGDDVDGELARGGEIGRQRWRRCVLVGREPQPVASVVPPDPGSGARSEVSGAVPEHPVTLVRWW
jgi:hypothetical protein